MECTLAGRLPALLAGLNAAWPTIAVSLSAAPSTHLLQAVATHQPDCAFAAQPPGGALLNGMDVQRMPAFEKELQLLSPSGY